MDVALAILNISVTPCTDNIILLDNKVVFITLMPLFENHILHPYSLYCTPCG